MSHLDDTFIYTTKKILNEGFNDYDQQVRPKWADGTPAHTCMAHAVVNKYDIMKEFPMPTLRKLSLNNCVAELVWIWSKKSNKTSELTRADGTRIKVWDQWIDENGTIGKAYGYQLGVKYPQPVISSTIVGCEEVDGKMLNYVEIEGKKFYTRQHKNKEVIDIDQVDDVLYNLKNNPANRRVLTNIFNHRELMDMGLAPCAWNMTFMVDTQNKKLNAILNQRSQDMLAANGWNVAQYSALVCMFARASGLQPGELTHIIANAHIYDRHLDFVGEMVKEYEKGNVFPAPKVILNPEKVNFYDITDADFIVENYQYNKTIEEIQKKMFPEGRIPVAE